MSSNVTSRFGFLRVLAILLQMLLTVLAFFVGQAPIQIVFLNAEKASLPLRDGYVNLREVDLPGIRTTEDAPIAAQRVDRPLRLIPMQNSLSAERKARAEVALPFGDLMASESLILEAAEGTLFVLTDQYSWLRGQVGTNLRRPQIVRDGRPVPVDEIVGFLRWPDLREHLQEATDVIAVGMASCEGDSQEEFRRAGSRAHQMLTWLRQAYRRTELPHLRVRTLNLGRFSRECPGARAEETQFQRRIVLLALRQSYPGRSLDNQDILDALRASRILGLDPYDYEAASLGPSDVF